jgi:multiple sugar transport system substrate-binding protein
VIYRKDLWDGVGRAPDSWDDVRLGGRRIKFMQGPSVGISLGSDVDAEGGWRALLYSFGGSEQDADNRPALKSPATLEALKFAKALYDEAMPEDVLTWDNISNNRTMLAGEISLTLNPITITRTGENKQFAVTDQLWLAATPAGPAHRLAPINGDGAWLIPTFSQNIEAAQRYLVDYIGHSREWFLASRFFALPTFPQTVPDMPQLLASDSEATPADKYKILADALNWTTNFGYPGYNNPAIGDIYNSNLIPTMFANVASAKMTPEEAMTQADQEVRKIFQKWQDLGKV